MRPPFHFQTSPTARHAGISPLLHITCPSGRPGFCASPAPSKDQYRIGTVSYVNAVLAQATALTAERNLLDLRTRHLSAANQLLKTWPAMGGPAFDHVLHHAQSVMRSAPT